jgi:spermidine/putrescine transport system permease protein
VSEAATRVRAGGASRAGASDRVVDGALRAFGSLVYVFLYAPIVVVIIYAFNQSRLVEVWNGFGLHYWASTWSDPTVRASFVLSLWTAATNSVLATALGTAAALGLRNVGRRVRTTYDGFMYTAIIVPEIVIAIASLLFLTQINFPLGPWAIVATHAVFNTSVVTLICRARLASMDRSLEEASADLGASRWGTFRQVTLPQLWPAVMAGALLGFTFSFDDVVLSTFVTSPGATTLPLRVFSELRFGLSPTANVIATSMLGITLTAVVTAQTLLRRAEARSGARSAAAASARIAEGMA